MALRTSSSQRDQQRAFDALDAPLTRTSRSASDEARAGLKAEGAAMLRTIGGTLAVLWVIQIINVSGWLNSFGIFPRTLSGLVGLVTAPFLHGGFGHLIANTIGILTVGAMVVLRSRRHFVQVAVIGAILGGGLVWLFGRSAYHVGASGVLFAWLGYLLTTGIFERRLLSIATSVLAFIFFGGMVWGVLPTLPGVSWESHLFGFLAGVVAARALATPANRRLSAE